MDDERNGLGDAPWTPWGGSVSMVHPRQRCFLTPCGYQIHLMGYSPGRYRVQDFLKTGLPVSLTYSARVLVLTPMAFPL